jgi:hypothetical protein
MNARVLTLALVSLLAAQTSFAADDDVTGLFSTFVLGGKLGDISGAEIHIVPNPKGYSAVVQASEGAPGFPEVVEVVVKGTTLVFTIPAVSSSGFSPGTYNGTVTKEGLRLRGPRGLYGDYFLPRKRSFWQ